MPQDRTLSVQMTFQGYYDANGPAGPGYYGNVGYANVGTSPTLPAGLQLVAADGTIAIGAWANPDPAIWNDTVDITFTLAGQCTLQDGQVVPVVWSPNMNNDPDGQPAMLLMETDRVTPASASEVEASWVTGTGNTQILVNDKDETKDYYFRPAIIIPAANNYYISCDPPLVNRRGTGK